MRPTREIGQFSHATSWRIFAVLATSLLATSLHALTLTGVQSRKVHGADGAQDIAIARGVGVSGPVTVEPRAIGSGHVIVFQFDQAVTLGPAHSFDLTNETGVSLIGQAGIGMSVALVPMASNEVAATLTGIADNRRVTVWLNDIRGTDMSAQNVRASVGFLRGDTNNSRSVDATDKVRVKARSGQPASQGGREYDLNTSGLISGADISAVKSLGARSLVAGNIAPVVSAGGNQTIAFPATVTLNGSVTDDGFPAPPTLTLTWSTAAGPAAAMFDNANAAQTTATLPQGGAYTLRLTASDGQLSSSADAIITANVVSTPFIGGLAGGVVAGANHSITVTMRDAQSNVVTGYSGTVRFTSSDPQAVLPPNYTFVPADAGVRVFNGVQLRTSGARSITVSDIVTSNNSSANTLVGPGAAAVLAFVQQPGNGTVRSNLTPAVQVAINDAFGNRTNSTSTVTLALANNPGGATLVGATARAAVGGLATFDDLQMTNEGDGFTLQATASGLPNLTSIAFNIVDDISPAAVADLAIDSTTQTGAVLSWIATGDDATLGTAASYTLKAHTAPITQANFDTVGTVVPTGAPAAPGSPEGATASALSANTLYYFALRVADGAGNRVFAFTSGSTLPCDTGYTGPTCSACANGYVSSGGFCVPVCNTNVCIPPAPACSTGTVLVTYSGVCSPGATSPYYSCSYPPTSTDCSAFGRICTTVNDVAACRVP
jgi:Dockerin type I domain